MYLMHVFIYAIVIYAACWALWYTILIRPTRIQEFVVIPFMVLRHAIYFTIGGLIVLFLF